MINIAICDDDETVIEVLKNLLEKYRIEHQTEMKFSCYKAAEQYMEKWKISDEADILLLDIEMKDLDGIQLKEYLHLKKSKTKILFITSHAEIMPEAFGMNVYGFLKKPVDKKILFKYLNKMCNDLKDEKSIVLMINGKKRVIKIRDVLYIMAEGRYSFLVLNNGKILSDGWACE